MVEYVRGGVTFEWSQLEEIDNCLWKARVGIGDVCHRIEGELLICCQEVNGRPQWQWILTVGDKGHPPGTNGKVSFDLDEFMDSAERGTIGILTDELQKSHDNTRRLQERQRAQQGRADAVGEVLRKRL